MEIFLGSSTQSTNYMREIAVWIEAKKHKPRPWDTPGVFPPGTYTFQRLIEISKSVQGAVFIFAEEDIQWYRNDATKVTRDNVLLEYGLFTGALGLKSAIICRAGNPKSPSDLAGITYININDDSKAHARMEIENWLAELSPKPAPLQPSLETSQTTTQLFDKRDKLGNDEVHLLKLLIQFGKQNDFAMTYVDIIQKYIEDGSAGKNTNADIPLAKLIKRGFIQLEPGKIKACSITTTAWEWIKQSDDLMNNSQIKA